MTELQTKQRTNHNHVQTKTMIHLKNIEKVYRTDTVETLALKQHQSRHCQRRISFHHGSVRLRQKHVA